MSSLRVIALAGVLLVVACSDGNAPNVGAKPSAPLPGAIHVAVGRNAGTPAAGAGSLWVPNTSDGTLSRIDPGSNRVQATVKIGEVATLLAAGCGPSSVHSLMGPTFNQRHCDLPSSVAVTSESVWVAANDQGGVMRLDPKTNRITATVAMGILPFYLAADDREVWGTSFQDAAIARVDAVTARVLNVWRGFCRGPSGVALTSDSALIACDTSGTLVRIDRATGTVVASIALPGGIGPSPYFGPRPLAVALAAGDVWVRNEGNNTVSRVSLRSNSVIAVVPVDAFFGRDGLDALAVDSHGIWVSGVRLQMIDPASNQVTRRVDLRTITIGAGFNSLWVIDDFGEVLRLQL